MSIPQSIIQKDKELLELVFKKNQLVNSSKGSVAKHKKIESKIKLIKHERFLLLDKYLMESDAEYGKIAKQNLVLFASPSVRVKVTSEDYSIMGSYSRELEGKISTNGYSYGKSSLTNKHYHELFCSVLNESRKLCRAAAILKTMF